MFNLRFSKGRRSIGKARATRWCCPPAFVFVFFISSICIFLFHLKHLYFSFHFNYLYFFFISSICNFLFDLKHIYFSFHFNCSFLFVFVFFISSICICLFSRHFSISSICICLFHIKHLYFCILCLFVRLFVVFVCALKYLIF